MLSRQRGTDSLNVLEEGARGAPAASDVSIIPGGIETRIWFGAKREREVRCRAIDRPGDHAHPGETRALMLQVKIERRPGQTRREAGSAAPSRLLCVLTSCTYLYPTAINQTSVGSPAATQFGPVSPLFCLDLPFESRAITVSRLGHDMKIYNAG